MVALISTKMVGSILIVAFSLVVVSSERKENNDRENEGIESEEDSQQNRKDKSG